MQTHLTSITMPVEFNELLDEEFDAFDISAPIEETPAMKCGSLWCDEKSWEDEEDY